MSEPIGVGDWVECVKAYDPSPIMPDSPGDWGVLCNGKVYRVARVGVGRISGHDLLWLAGVPDSAEGGYCAWRFKPVYRPSESLFLTRLMDVPADPEKVMA